MYCKYCGKEMEDGARFCPSCGNETGAGQPQTEFEINDKGQKEQIVTEQQTETNTQAEPKPNEGKQKHKRHLMPVIIAIAVVIALALAAVFFVKTKVVSPKLEGTADVEGLKIKAEYKGDDVTLTYQNDSQYSYCIGFSSSTLVELKDKDGNICNSSQKAVKIDPGEDTNVTVSFHDVEIRPTIVVLHDLFQLDNWGLPDGRCNIVVQFGHDLSYDLEDEEDQDSDGDDDWEQEWEDFWGYDGSEDSQNQETAPDQSGNSSEQDIQKWQEEQQRQNEKWFEEQQRQQDEWLRQQQEQMYQ